MVEYNEGGKEMLNNIPVCEVQSVKKELDLMGCNIDKLNDIMCDIARFIGAEVIPNDTKVNIENMLMDIKQKNQDLSYAIAMADGICRVLVVEK